MLVGISFVAYKIFHPSLRTPSSKTEIENTSTPTPSTENQSLPQDEKVKNNPEETPVSNEQTIKCLGADRKFAYLTKEVCDANRKYWTARNGTFPTDPEEIIKCQGADGKYSYVPRKTCEDTNKFWADHPPQGTSNSSSTTSTSNSTSSVTVSIPYYQQIINTFGSSLIGYWPLSEASGTVATDLSGNSRNGVHTNITLGQTGIGDDLTSAKYNGATSKTNIYSASLSSALDGNEGTLIAWIKPIDGTVWTDGLTRNIFNFYVDANNSISIAKGLVGTINATQRAGGVSIINTFEPRGNSTDWMRVTMTWSKSLNQFYTYVNDNPIYPVQTGLGTFAGALNSNYANIGAFSTNTQVWNGYIAHSILLNRAITANEVVNMGIGSIKRFTFLGDSISTVLSNFPSLVPPGYGRSVINNHAVGGAGILFADNSTMAQQVAASASDNADIIIVELGTNDYEPGDMTALQTAVETNIAALKISNPNATIYFLNVLPRWTNSGGGTPVDKSLIRTAIAAACTAQSITCWDTFTTPWITAADTSDGLHPTYLGSRKIAQKIWSLLP